VSEWILLRCRAQKESKAQEWLAGIGIETIVVREHKLKKSSRHIRGSGKREEISVPLMPGYIIANIGDGSLFYRMMREREYGPMRVIIHPMVRDDTQLGSKPVFVRQADVEKLQDMQAEFDKVRNDRLRRHMNINHEFEPGDDVEVIDGLLEGQIVKVQSISDDGYVVLDIAGPAKVRVLAETLAKRRA